MVEVRFTLGHDHEFQLGCGLGPTRNLLDRALSQKLCCFIFPQGEEVDDLLPRLHGLRWRHPAADGQLHPLLRQEHQELQAAPPHRPLHHAPLSAQVCSARFNAISMHAQKAPSQIPSNSLAHILVPKQHLQMCLESE